MTAQTPEPHGQVRALMAALHDGLLDDYVGWAEPDHYNVVIADRPVSLAAADVVDTIGRLRALRTLAAECPQLALTGVHGRGHHFRLVLRTRRAGSVTVPVPAVDAVAYAQGFAVATAAGAPRARTQLDNMAAIAPVLTDPGLGDQCRLYLLALMEAGQVSKAELARRVGVTTKTVSVALGFGRWLSIKMAEQMVAALGAQWVVGLDGDRWIMGIAAGGTRNAMPESTDIRRLRRLLQAHLAGHIRYIGPGDVNAARWARKFTVETGRTSRTTTHTIAAGDVEAWLDGVAAYHANDDGSTP